MRLSLSGCRVEIALLVISLFPNFAASPVLCSLNRSSCFTYINFFLASSVGTLSWLNLFFLMSWTTLEQKLLLRAGEMVLVRHCKTLRYKSCNLGTRYRYWASILLAGRAVRLELPMNTCLLCCYWVSLAPGMEWHSKFWEKKIPLNLV